MCWFSIQFWQKVWSCSNYRWILMFLLCLENVSKNRQNCLRNLSITLPVNVFHMILISSPLGVCKLFSTFLQICLTWLLPRKTLVELRNVTPLLKKSNSHHIAAVLFAPKTYPTCLFQYPLATILLTSITPASHNRNQAIRMANYAAIAICPLQWIGNRSMTTANSLSWQSFYGMTTG